MQRQAVPLSRSEKCIVGTGLEGQTALDDGLSVIAEHLGKVIYTETHKILFILFCIVVGHVRLCFCLSVHMIIYKENSFFFFCFFLFSIGSIYVRIVSQN